MSFDPINPQIFHQPQMIQQNSFRLVQGGSLLDKPTFGEKFLMGLKKFGSIFGRIAGGIVSMFPGWGQVASSALYGISNFAQRSYEKSLNKRMESLALDEAAAQANFQMLTPGFGMFGSPGGVGVPDTNDGLSMQKLDVVLNKEAAAFSANEMVY